MEARYNYCGDRFRETISFRPSLSGLRYKQGKQSCYLNFTEIDTFFPRIVFLFHPTKKSSKIYRVIS